MLGRMKLWRRSRATIVALALATALFALWTAFLGPLSDAIDGWWHWDPPSKEGILGQIASGVALIASPLVVIALLGVATWWSLNRRLKAMAAAIMLAAVLTWSASRLFMHLVGRPSPDSPWDYLITSSRFAYPSTHVAAVTMAAILMVALTTMTRRSSATILTWRVVGAVGVVLVALDRLLLHAASVTDVVGGALLGSATTLAAMLICDVHAHTPGQKVSSEKSKGWAAVIYNPTKIPDKNTFMRLVEATVTDMGWPPPIWLSTTPDDPGHEMAHAARDAGVDVVIVAGGDGTVRVVCGEMSGSGIPLVIVPAGTGNLLARNVGIPLDYDRALRLLAEGEARPMDVVKFTSRDDDFGTEYSVVMSGMGIDAAVMHDTDEDLKKQIGSLAYFAAGIQHLKVDPMDATLTLDDGAAQEVRASFIGIGNVGAIQGGLTVIPEASASDGRMDIMLADPHNASEIAEMLAGVLTTADTVQHVTRATAGTMELEMSEPQLFQIDGDLLGEVRHLRAEVMHHAIKVMLPPM